jgi:spermidine/putrescine transport system ATP-binding protein
MLALRNISISYDHKPLLTDISIQLAAGETLALLGPSGSGKTTLLRIIAGLEQPESGDVFWDQTSLRAVPPDQRKFGLVFQDYALFPHLDVAGNIGFGLRMRGIPAPEIHATIEEMLNLVNLPGCERRRVDSLSGGEQQRVALARALAIRPRMLMLDEPLSALDRELRRELAGEIKRILRLARIPAIYVTHDQEEAFSIASRIAILHAGRILQDGSPEDIFYHPAAGWIAEFLGVGTVIVGTVVKIKPLQVRTRLGGFTLSEKVPRLRLNQKIRLLLRPENGKLERIAKRGTLWKAGTVQDIRRQGTWNRVLVSLADGFHVSCDTRQPMPIGTSVWWYPGEVQYIESEE